MSIVSLFGVLNFGVCQFSGDSFKKSGPDNHWLFLFNWSMEKSLLTRSAGLSLQCTYLQCAGCADGWISHTRFATKGLNFWLIPLIHQRRFRLLHQNITFSMLVSYTSIILFASFSPKDTLKNSNLGMLVVFSVDFDITSWVIPIWKYRVITDRQHFHRLFLMHHWTRGRLLLLFLQKSASILGFALLIIWSGLSAILKFYHLDDVVMVHPSLIYSAKPPKVISSFEQKMMKGIQGIKYGRELLEKLNFCVSIMTWPEWIIFKCKYVILLLPHYIKCFN